MPVPARDSRTTPLTSDVARLLDVLATVRRLSVRWQTTLLGDTPVADIVDNIYVPFVRSDGYWRYVQDVRTRGGFSKLFLEELGMRFALGPADIKPTLNRILLGDNGLAVNDPVRWREHDTLPAPFVAGTTYFVLAKPTSGTITLSTTVGGVEIDITDSGTGSNVLRFGLNPELNVLEAALEAVIDEIIAVVPVTPTTLEVRALKFDKALAASNNGLSNSMLTAAQTATLRSKLLDVQNAIEAPA